jgi:hypothetical protein
MSGKKTHWPRHSRQAALKRASFGLVDAVGNRFAYCGTDDGIARAEHLMQVCSCWPPFRNLTPELPFLLSSPQMAIVGKD